MGRSICAELRANADAVLDVIPRAHDDDVTLFGALENLGRETRLLANSEGSSRGPPRVHDEHRPAVERERSPHPAERAQ